MTHGAHKKDNFSNVVYNLLNVFQSLKKNANKKYTIKMTINNGKKGKNPVKKMVNCNKSTQFSHSMTIL